VEQQTCTIEDVTSPVVRPTTAADLTGLVRHAAADGTALFPLGGRSHLHIGQPPSRHGLGVDLTAFNAIIDYPARDMTITVQAGMPLAELARILATERQRLPVDVPCPDRATVGGALAVNASGPRRFGFGTFRDYVLGLSAVNNLGEETKSGGRVVKNVAGYDIHKLHIGALGTLGIITQVTFKLRPLLEASVLVTLGCAAEDLTELLDLINRTRSRPICVDVVNAAAAADVAGLGPLALPSADWVILVGYEDSEATVDWQVGQLLRELPAERVHGLEVRAGKVADPLWRSLTDFTTTPSLLSFKAGLLPAQVGAFCKQASVLPGVHLHAHAGSGIVYGHLGGPLTLAAVPDMLKEVRRAAETGRGSLILTRCPTVWKKTLPVWGPPRSDAALARRIKEQFDPQGIFNPGRLG
jgi:glycolate oxidase FAD binding subunit